MAAACARLGLRSAWIFGAPAPTPGVSGCGASSRARRRLLVRAHDGRRPGRPLLPRVRRGAATDSVLYDRRDSAFARLTAEAVDWEPVRRARLVHVTGITPALGAGPRADASSTALREAASCLFDRQLPEPRCGRRAEARAFAESVLPGARYLFMGEAEARIRVRPERLGRGDARGARPGSRPRRRSRCCRGRRASTVLDGGPPLARRVGTHAVQMVDPVGAGDAYVAGFLWAT